MSKSYRLYDDTFFKVDQATGKRILKEEFLEEVLDAIAECNGGYSICRGGLILFDTVTGDKRLITSASGVVVNSLITD